VEAGLQGQKCPPKCWERAREAKVATDKNTARFDEMRLLWLLASRGASNALDRCRRLTDTDTPVLPS